ncbi:uncharacterized protein MONOS_10425 [Monocercomonoides exilis]|uniref:uncharacterized protein n=1 Tax=Monocercomonoides exilis TaxID=2049356 RepID=UPI00355A07B0|nr:hypothetical protein MONOS_10425 [Monocercomonoides exilis]|eukprot:MONOS_10425.1-p1 / transcript=MONOS_10425.1 / gene=MONOS_10425 / organism=Monocercomonoides_exilis_PA203 / gene_product=unspecified product / transcript_product=unspecified product / location=Mono_scaffold00474:11934-13847(+) / protein_length=638 / sequence_SO=supercontig / SO=protein_coding / is_pseudo=false
MSIITASPIPSVSVTSSPSNIDSIITSSFPSTQATFADTSRKTPQKQHLKFTSSDKKLRKREVSLPPLHQHPASLSSSISTSSSTHETLPLGHASFSSRSLPYNTSNWLSQTAPASLSAFSPLPVTAVNFGLSSVKYSNKNHSKRTIVEIQKELSHEQSEKSSGLNPSFPVITPSTFQSPTLTRQFIPHAGSKSIRPNTTTGSFKYHYSYPSQASSTPPIIPSSTSIIRSAGPVTATNSPHSPHSSIRYETSHQHTQNHRIYEPPTMFSKPRASPKMTSSSLDTPGTGVNEIQPNQNNRFVLMEFGSSPKDAPKDSPLHTTYQAGHHNQRRLSLKSSSDMSPNMLPVRPAPARYSVGAPPSSPTSSFGSAQTNHSHSSSITHSTQKRQEKTLQHDPLASPQKAADSLSSSSSAAVTCPSPSSSPISSSSSSPTSSSLQPPSLNAAEASATFSADETSNSQTQHSQQLPSQSNTQLSSSQNTPQKASDSQLLEFPECLPDKSNESNDRQNVNESEECGCGSDEKIMMSQQSHEALNTEDKQLPNEASYPSISSTVTSASEQSIEQSAAHDVPLPTASASNSFSAACPLLLSSSADEGNSVNTSIEQQNDGTVLGVAENIALQTEQMRQTLALLMEDSN